jgi:plastocyanin
MSVPCGVITVRKPANITATNMTVQPTDCDEPCNVTVTVTWKNTGGRTATITPAIVVDTTRTEGAPITLAKNETVTITFNVAGLIEGTYNVCPDPN